MNLPNLPPGWTWHSSNGLPTSMIQYRATGPVVSGRWPIEAHAEMKPDDTPEGCAAVAWGIWERLSGMTRKQLDESARIRTWLNEQRESGRKFAQNDINAYCLWADHADEIDELLGEST